jgi:hypothetical protein
VSTALDMPVLDSSGFSRGLYAPRGHGMHDNLSGPGCPGHPARSLPPWDPAYDNNKPESVQMGAYGGQHGDRAGKGMNTSDFIHVSALSASHARENSKSTFIQGYTDPRANNGAIDTTTNTRGPRTFVRLFYFLTGCPQGAEGQ